MPYGTGLSPPMFGVQGFLRSKTFKEEIYNTLETRL